MYRPGVEDEPILPPGELRRYADAIVKTSLGVRKGDTLVVTGEPAHRELVVAVADAGYRAGALIVDVWYLDSRVARARLLHASNDALGVVTPWAERRYRELAKPTSARAAITGESEPGYLDGVSPKRLRADISGSATNRAFTAYRRANLDLKARWTGVAWPTDHWAGQVYPGLPPLEGKRRLAQDLLWFCRLTDADGKGAAGWLAHVRALTRRSQKLTRLGLTALELRGPGTELDLRLAPETRWIGGQEETSSGIKIAPNMPTEESFTSPHAAGTEGTFTCTFPLSFEGRLIEGLRGEFRGGKLVRLDAKSKKDRDFVAAHLDSDPKGNGRKLGEVALVDASSRIGQSGHTYFKTLLDENAAAHIALGAGFGGTRTGKRAIGLNRSTVHLDVMIGGPDFEATGITAKGKRVPVIADGLWQI
ncbi:MAG: aminopeptidase [Gaiellaceae bacterium]|nr:aminopeptidase [Gaiellaceae bacterium]